MLTVRIVTLQGETVQLQVMQAEFVVTCPYCSTPFRTIEVDQKFSSTSHRVMHWRKHHATAALTLKPVLKPHL